MSKKHHSDSREDQRNTILILEKIKETPLYLRNRYECLRCVNSRIDSTPSPPTPTQLINDRQQTYTTIELHNLILHLNKLISLKEIIIKSHMFTITHMSLYISLNT